MGLGFLLGALVTLGESLRGNLPALTPTVQLQIIEPVGAFHNWRFTGEHQYGFEIRLWKSDHMGLLGCFSHHEGLAGDAPRSVFTLLKPESTDGGLDLHAILASDQPRDQRFFHLTGQRSVDLIVARIEERVGPDLVRSRLVQTHEVTLRRDPDQVLGGFRSWDSWRRAECDR